MESTKIENYHPKFALNFIFSETTKLQFGDLVSSVLSYASSPSETLKLEINKSVKSLLVKMPEMDETFGHYTRLIKCVCELVVNQNAERIDTILTLIRCLLEEINYFEMELMSLVYLASDFLIFRQRNLAKQGELKAIIEVLLAHLKMDMSVPKTDSFKSAFRILAISFDIFYAISVEKNLEILLIKSDEIIAISNFLQNSIFSNFLGHFSFVFSLFEVFFELWIDLQKSEFNKIQKPEYWKMKNMKTGKVEITNLLISKKNELKSLQNGKFLGNCCFFLKWKKSQFLLNLNSFDKKKITQTEKKILNLKKTKLYLQFFCFEKEKFIEKSICFFSQTSILNIQTGKTSIYYDEDLLRLLILSINEKTDYFESAILSQFLQTENCEIKFPEIVAKMTEINPELLGFVYDHNLLESLYAINEATGKNKILNKKIIERINHADVIRAMNVSGRIVVENTQIERFFDYLKAAVFFKNF